MLVISGRLVTVGTLELRVDNFPKYLVVNIDTGITINSN